MKSEKKGDTAKRLKRRKSHSRLDSKVAQVLAVDVSGERDGHTDQHTSSDNNFTRLLNSVGVSAPESSFQRDTKAK